MRRRWKRNRSSFPPLFPMDDTPTPCHFCSGIRPWTLSNISLLELQVFDHEKWCDPPHSSFLPRACSPSTPDHEGEALRYGIRRPFTLPAHEGRAGSAGGRRRGQVREKGLLRRALSCASTTGWLLSLSRWQSLRCSG